MSRRKFDPLIKRTAAQSGMKPNTTIYLFRHGETDWNVEGRRQGRLVSPLTQGGEFQAEKNAMRVRKRLSLDADVAFFASPLGRARQTALIMAKELGIPEQAIVFEPRLMECSFGVWEGLTTSEIKARYLDEWRARSKDKWNVPAPSGESYAAGICMVGRGIIRGNQLSCLSRSDLSSSSRHLF